MIAFTSETKFRTLFSGKSARGGGGGEMIDVHQDRFCPDVFALKVACDW